MRVVGLDLSLRSTGIADDEGTRVITTAEKGMARLFYLRQFVLDAVMPMDPDGMPLPVLVAVEGYAFARQNQQAHLGELGGVVRMGLFENGVPWVDVPPASLKKYATGKGNANKGQVLEAASKRSGLDFGGDDNRADAWWLRQAALDWYGLSTIRMPESHRLALHNIPWPTLDLKTERVEA